MSFSVTAFIPITCCIFSFFHWQAGPCPFCSWLGKAAFSPTAALTVGSCASGILEIYGTTSDLIPIYWIFGSLTIGSALLLYGLTPKNNVEEK